MKPASVWRPLEHSTQALAVIQAPVCRSAYDRTKLLDKAAFRDFAVEIVRRLASTA